MVVHQGSDSRVFDIQIASPYETDDGDYCCEMQTDDVLFSGIQKVFGVDALDALDYAIQAIDVAANKFVVGTLQWPDGSPYKRVPSGRKLDWASN